MSRLCERPGCSDAAAVAYGMRTDDLVFWLDALTDGAHPHSGVLCRRHADSMVVPRGWTLDDLRDPDLHLFRPPARGERTTGRPRRRPATPDGPSGQLELDGVQPPVEPVTSDDASAPDDTTHDTADGDDVGIADASGTRETDEPGEMSWRPTFDADDDLDGLLSARSPLLSRAFRGTDRTS